MKPLSWVFALMVLTAAVVSQSAWAGSVDTNARFQSALQKGLLDALPGQNNVPVSVVISEAAKQVKIGTVSFSKHLKLHLAGQTQNMDLAEKIVNMLDALADVTLKLGSNCKLLSANVDTSLDVTGISSGKLVVNGKTIYVDPAALASTMKVNVSSLKAIGKAIKINDGACDCSDCNYAVNITVSVKATVRHTQGAEDQCIAFRPQVTNLCRSVKPGRYCHPCPLRADWWVMCLPGGKYHEYICTADKYYEPREGKCIPLPASCTNSSAICDVPECPPIPPPATCTNYTLLSKPNSWSTTRSTVKAALIKLTKAHRGTTATLTRGPTTCTADASSLTLCSPTPRSTFSPLLKSSLLPRTATPTPLLSLTPRPPGSPTPTPSCYRYTLLTRANDWSWASLNLAKTLARFTSTNPGSFYTLTRTSHRPTGDTATLTLTTLTASHSSTTAWLTTNLSNQGYIKNLLPLATCCTRTPPKPPAVACLKFQVVARSNDWAWSKLSVNKVMQEFVTKYPESTYQLVKDAPRPDHGGKDAGTLTVRTMAADKKAAAAWLKDRLMDKGKKYVQAVAAGAC